MAAATDGETSNPNGEVDPPVRRSLGRRKSCKGSETSSSSSMAKKKKKKVPQRGMGIDKLERQRIEAEWKKMKEITHQPFITLNPINISPNLHYLGFPNSDLHFGINNHSAGFSKELSSTPNSVNCNSHHCNACHKKKKVNSRNLGSETCVFAGMNFRENQNITVGNGNKSGEVHRKGSSSDVLVSGRRVMEYDFFPPPHKADRDISSSPSPPPPPPQNCLCLDLSLKL